MIGCPLSDFVHRAEDFIGIAAHLEKHDKWRGELTARRKNGAPFAVELSSYRLRDDKGTPTCLLVSCADISERIKAEQTLRDSDRMKSEFISTASHELRTPLTAVQGYAEYLLTHADADPEMQRRCLVAIFEKAQSLARIISDLLDLTRVEAGQLICLHKKRVDTRKLLAGMIDQIAAKATRHRLEMHLPEGPVLLTIDAGKVEQVLENLLSNAVKYSPQGGRILIRGEFRGTNFLFTIADEGIGMTPEQINRVFDKFYRADGSNTAIEGMGLGMSIARKIVEEHGGRIWLASEPGRGTQVYFTLPAA
jgi:signal transduction histidine kinase